jgi:hypothetical protein
MRSVIYKILGYICCLIGHKFDDVDMCMLYIKSTSKNSEDHGYKITCTRCRKEIDLSE